VDCVEVRLMDSAFKQKPATAFSNATRRNLTHEIGEPIESIDVWITRSIMYFA